MKTIYAAIIALTTLGLSPVASGAQTAVEQISEQDGIVQGNLEPHEGTVPQFRSPGTTSPLVLEYKLGTHVEAVARKYGQLDRIAKACGYPEYWNFEEASLADLIGDNLTTTTVGIVKRSYVEGQNLKTPPCDQSEAFINRMVEQVNRHRKIILETSEKIAQVNGAGRDQTEKQD